MADQQKVVGQVKWFSDERGFGFISRNGVEDVFVHHTQIQMEGRRYLERGQDVEYVEGPSSRLGRKLEAFDVKILG